MKLFKNMHLCIQDGVKCMINNRSLNAFLWPDKFKHEIFICIKSNFSNTFMVQNNLRKAILKSFVFSTSKIGHLKMCS